MQLSGDSDNPWTGPLGRVLAGRLRAIGARQSAVAFTVKPHRADLELLVELIDAGVVRVVVDRTVPLEAVPDALEQLEAGHTRGKAVVRLVGAAATAVQPPRHSSARSA